ncbi:MAG: cell division protein ZapA [Salaquimonas sp.]|jgi:cell division protein ZapA|nr:cell division protein ZapA [Salaquimonas sp.]
MAQVTVSINGKTYRMACEEGQEQNLRELAERFNSYVGQLKGAFGEIGDQRLTVMAGIMVTDELQEAARRIRTLEADLETLRSSRDEALGKAYSAESELARQVHGIAERIEAVGAKLAQPKPAK